MVAQGVPGVFGPECTAFLQQGHHPVDELVEPAWGQMRDEDEAVAGVGLDVQVDLVGDLGWCADNLSIRELVIAVTSRQQFVGTPAQVADEIDLHIQADACDGFILVPHLTPHGLDEFVDRVVPLLQERGAFRTEYTGHTLRDHLCL